MVKRKTVSDYVFEEAWLNARDTMQNPNICFIGEKYKYSEFPRDEKYILENLARKAIQDKDEYTWRDLVKIRDRLAEFLHVRVKGSRKAN